MCVTFDVDISQRDWFNVHVCTGNSMQKGKPKALRNNVGEIANVNAGSRESPPLPPSEWERTSPLQFDVGISFIWLDRGRVYDLKGLNVLLNVMQG